MMPYLVDGESDIAAHEVPWRRVFLDETLKGHHPNEMFGRHEDGRQWFERAKLESERTKTILLRPRKTLPARTNFGPLDNLHICDRAKRIIEELEPGKHRFARLPLYQSDGITPWPEDYWYWHCDNYTGAVIANGGEGGSGGSPRLFWDEKRGHAVDEDGYTVTCKLSAKGAVLNRDAIRGLHAWKDVAFFKGAGIYFFSDELVGRLRAAKALFGFGVAELRTSDAEPMRVQGI